MVARIHADDPAPLVAAAFRRIEVERMHDVPILNPALQVESVGFQRWQGHWLGVLVTPWAMNLMLLRGSEEDWEFPAPGKRRFVHFPSGDYAFLGGDEEEIGEYQSCALFSPMSQFADQETARLTAEASLAALLKAPAAAPENEPQSPSRRGFLSGRFR